MGDTEGTYILGFIRNGMTVILHNYFPYTMIMLYHFVVFLELKQTRAENLVWWIVRGLVEAREMEVRSEEDAQCMGPNRCHE